MTPVRNADGTLPLHSWSGGYPICYRYPDALLCGACANIRKDEPTSADTLRDIPVRCMGCGHIIQTVERVNAAKFGSGSSDRSQG